MCQNLFDENGLRFVIDAGDQSVIVAADVENRASLINVN
jgi:hypothetical protein